MPQTYQQELMLPVRTFDDCTHNFSLIRFAGRDEQFTRTAYTPTFEAVLPKLSGEALRQPTQTGYELTGYYATAYGMAHVWVDWYLETLGTFDAGHGAWSFSLPSGVVPSDNTICWSGSASIQGNWTQVKYHTLSSLIRPGETYMVFPGISAPGCFGGAVGSGSSLGLTELSFITSGFRLTAAISYPVA